MKYKFRDGAPVWVRGVASGPVTSRGTMTVMMSDEPHHPGTMEVCVQAREVFARDSGDPPIVPIEIRIGYPERKHCTDAGGGDYHSERVDGVMGIDICTEGGELMRLPVWVCNAIIDAVLAMHGEERGR